MITGRESMTLNESSVPAQGVEERSDEAPRAGRARPTPDSEVVASSPRSIGCGSLRRRSAVRSPVRWVGCFAARGCTAPI